MQSLVACASDVCTRPSVIGVPSGGVWLRGDPSPGRRHKTLDTGHLDRVRSLAGQCRVGEVNIAELTPSPESSFSQPSSSFSSHRHDVYRHVLHVVALFGHLAEFFEISVSKHQQIQR